MLDVAQCNKEIRELFMKNIIEAKGIARAKEIIKDVIMPTPSAVLEAAKLVAEGCGDAAGLGELIRNLEKLDDGTEPIRLPG